MLAPRPQKDMERSESYATFSKPNLPKNNMFTDDNEESIKLQYRSMRDDEEVKQYSFLS